MGHPKPCHKAVLHVGTSDWPPFPERLMVFVPSQDQEPGLAIWEPFPMKPTYPPHFVMLHLEKIWGPGRIPSPQGQSPRERLADSSGFLHTGPEANTAAQWLN